MKRIIVTYEGYEETNIGDYIQSLAAKQFVPKSEEQQIKYFNRDELNSYEEDAKVIMNGWFTHKPQNWPPSKSIKPLFVAFHLNSSAYKELLSPASLDYFKAHEPIGCRDENTTEVLRSHGVDAYFSSCLTTTLGYKYKSAENDGNIYVVDAVHYVPESQRRLQKYKFLLYYIIHFRGVNKFINSALKNNSYNVNLTNEYNRFCCLIRSYRIVKQLISKEDMEKVVVLTQFHHSFELPTNEERFSRAEDLLHKYARAKLVITSRIHVALPCTGLETPVIFLKNQEDSEESVCRFKGLLSLLNVIEFYRDHVVVCPFKTPLGNITNPTEYRVYADKLIAKCKSFFE